MKKFIKSRILFTFILIFVVLFIFGWHIISTGDPNKKVGFISSLIPVEVKISLKETIFFIPFTKKTIEKQKKYIEELEIKYFDLVKEQLINAGDQSLFSINAIDDTKIKSKFNSYILTYYLLPLKSWYMSYGTPFAYLEQTTERIILATGKGSFFTFDKNDIHTRSIKLKKIDTNIKQIIQDDRFYEPSNISIRDLLVINNLFFVSYAKAQSDNCHNTSILISEFDTNFLEFSEFFNYKECSPNGAQHSGGRMTSYKDNKILLTIGDYGHRSLAQDKNSMNGKIFSIDLVSRDFKLISMGHRNPQGLYYDKNDNIIILTEHGPYGGDEINVNFNHDNINVENYGWPISSYGEHYDGQFKKEAPLHKSHKDFGFIEPIKYFVPSIGISEVKRMPKEFNKYFTNDFFVASLGFDIDEGDLSVHHIRLNKTYDQVIFEDIIPIGDRIRDMIYLQDINKVLLTLENTSALAVLDIIN